MPPFLHQPNGYNTCCTKTAFLNGRPHIMHQLMVCRTWQSNSLEPHACSYMQLSTSSTSRHLALPKRPQQVIRLYWETLKYLESMTKKYKEEPTKLPRLLSLLPLCTIKRHFVTIDTKGLYNLSRNCGLVSKETKEPDFRALAADHFRSLFKVDKVADISMHHVSNLLGI